MKTITILGAGLSATDLIQYLLARAEKYDWKIRVGDFDLEVATRKTAGYQRGEAFFFDVNDGVLAEKTVIATDYMISMLPAMFHPIIAKLCLKHKKTMLTASYISNEMKLMHEDVRDAGIGFYNELGVDPGIDHMSAMRIIDRLKGEGATITGFYSSTGGLIAPEFDTNPWNYKFTWNPRNVVLAGQGVSMYIEKGQYKYVPYNQLFSRTMNTSVEGFGDFEIYPNRDSLKYRETYGLEGIPTLMRGTIRRPGYAKAWNVFVQLGMTDDSYHLENSETMTYRQFMNSFLPYHETLTLEEKLEKAMPMKVDSVVMDKLRWLGMFEDRVIGLPNASPAKIMQQLLEEKWKLGDSDKDMIVMQHRFEYFDKDKNFKTLNSSLVVLGENKNSTSMSKTVGLPLAIATKLVATGVIDIKGVSAPVIPEIYNPILDELEEFGVVFKED